MKEVNVKVYDSEESAYEIRNLRKLGYTRTQNAFGLSGEKKATTE